MSNPIASAQRDRLQQLWHELKQDLTELESPPQIYAISNRQARLARYTRDLRAQLDRHESAAVITLVGSSGAGKSTLLNALAGQAIALTGTTRPTTSRPVIYKPKNVDISALIDQLQNTGVFDAAHSIEIVDFKPQQTIRVLAQQVLIDAPDTNSVATEHRRIVEALAENSDALIVVTHRQSIAELASASFVDLFAGRRDLAFVLGRKDELDADSVSDLTTQLSKLAASRWAAPHAPVVAISALKAGSGEADAGFKQLTDYLASLAQSDHLHGLRRDNALGTATRIAELGTEIKAELTSGGGLVALRQSANQATATFRQRIETELRERLKLRTKDIELLLWNEAARRWQGPGGWALRTGGLTGLGLSAGALFARQNPMLAAGAAAGGMALDHAQSSLREGRIERASGLIPTAHELEAWYRESFAAPRLLAQEITGFPVAFGLPEAAALGQEATLAVESAWSHMVERELPQAAARGARRFTRWMVDLPVLLMCAWLVLQATVGVLPSTLTAQVLGQDMLPDALVMDDLVNAAIVLGAWLFLTRGVVRLHLGRLAKGLATAVESRAKAHLEEPNGIQTATSETFERRLINRSAALARLAELDQIWYQRLHGKHNPSFTNLPSKETNL